MTHARTEYKGCIRKAKYAFDKLQTNKLENARLKNAKEYWKLLKGTCSQTKSKSLTSDIFADYFKAINDPNDHFFQPDEDVLLFNDRYLRGELQVMFNELNVDITESEILKGIQQLNVGKSGGPDFLLNEFFKYGAQNLLPYITKLFNVILKLGQMD